MKKFSKIGIVGFKDKSADLANALDQIADWAATHPKVEFFALDSLKGLAKKPIHVIKESGLSRMDLLLVSAGTVRCFRPRISRSGITFPYSG